MSIGKEIEKERDNIPTLDSRYIQQHLANERTFLAWIRTAIAINHWSGFLSYEFTF